MKEVNRSVIVVREKNLFFNGSILFLILGNLLWTKSIKTAPLFYYLSMKMILKWKNSWSIITLSFLKSS